MWSAVLITDTVEYFPELSTEETRVDIDVEDVLSLAINKSSQKLKLYLLYLLATYSHIYTCNKCPLTSTKLLHLLCFVKLL